MKTLYKDNQWEVREEEGKLPDGRVVRWIRVRRPDAVHILAFLDREIVLMLRQFRPFYGEWNYMLPSGKVDKEKDIESAAQRELREETGYRAGKLTHFFSTNPSESLVYTSHVFIAENLEQDPLPQENDELINVEPMKLAAAVALAREGKIRHTASAYALLRYWIGREGPSPLPSPAGRGDEG